MVTCINQFVCNKDADKKMLNSRFKNFDVTPKELLENILKGYAVCTAEMKEDSDGFCQRNNDNFISCQVIGVDIDNQKHVKSNSNKNEKLCLSNEEGYLSYHDIVQDTFIKNNASFVYCTPSHTEDWNRFRIFFILKNKITDTEVQKKLNKVLTSYFNGDTATTTNCQIFYGSKDAKHEFFGNILDDEMVKELLNDYEIKFNSSKQREIESFNEHNFSKEQLQEIVNFVFKNGKISNDRWWKVPTILKNCGLLSDHEIHELIYNAVGDSNDISLKLKYADKYKHSLSLGTLIFYAKENGYELPADITSKAKNIKFWSINKKDEKLQVSISYNLLHKFLVNNGFWQIEHDKGSQLIRIDINNQIEEVSETCLREFVFNYVMNTKDLFESYKERDSVEEQLRRNSSMIFNSIKMNLPTFNSKLNEILTDTAKHSFIPFNNGFLKISDHEIQFSDYSKLKGYIWKKSVLKRDYKKLDDKKSEYHVFLEKVCTTRKENGKLDFNSAKFDSFRSVIGYLLHRYKNKANVKAVVMCDEAISSSPNGGTGKSIFADAIGKIRNSTVIDGRFFDANSQFRFETVNEATEVINIDDCSPKFQFDKLFHVITGDLTVERKGISRFTIPFERSPKICFSTNHTFYGDGNSHERRIFEIEFSNYFNQKNTPLDEFKHQLFHDWDSYEFNRFDKFMSECISFYLKKGLVGYETINLEYKKLVENTSEDLAEYLNEFMKHDTIYRTDDVLEDFSRVQKTNITQTAITQAINYWGYNYKKLRVIGEFDKTAKTRLFVVCLDNISTWKDWKKSEQYQKIKEGGNTHPSDYIDCSFEKLFDD